MMNKELITYCRQLEQEFSGIISGRVKTLQASGDYVLSKTGNGMKTNLIFICTHNSRRSQFAQLWAHLAAEYYGMQDITSYSGGTEATEFNPGAVFAVKRAGFTVESPAGKMKNPRYQLKSSNETDPIVMFSKIYDDPVNPSKDFAAVMVCSHADENCPVVQGADLKISLPYEDPKMFDGTAMESIKYDETCREIARDQFYLFKYVRERI